MWVGGGVHGIEFTGLDGKKNTSTVKGGGWKLEKKKTMNDDTRLQYNKIIHLYIYIKKKNDVSLLNFPEYYAVTFNVFLFSPSETRVLVVFISPIRIFIHFEYVIIFPGKPIYSDACTRNERVLVRI